MCVGSRSLKCSRAGVPALPLSPDGFQPAPLSLSGLLASLPVSLEVSVSFLPRIYPRGGRKPNPAAGISFLPGGWTQSGINLLVRVVEPGRSHWVKALPM